MFTNKIVVTRSACFPPKVTRNDVKMKPGYLASPLAPDGIEIRKKVIKYERSETQLVVIVILCIYPEKNDA